MIICVCSFTKTGNELAEKLKSLSPNTLWELQDKAEPLALWLEDCFSKRLPILFIGAAGIAVRKITPFVQDKLTDSPVVVMDEKGAFAIPLLGGHMGGANELARKLASLTGGISVITTATDVQGLFSVDVFASKNGLKIENREGIQKISTKLLEGKKISVWVEPEIKINDKNIPTELELLQKNRDSGKIPKFADLWISEKPILQGEMAEKCVLNLSAKKYCAGIGCKKGKTFEELQDFLYKNWNKPENLFAISTIDLKKREKGLLTLAQYLHTRFVTYSAEELRQAEGSFSESEFVEKTTGVSNICERAAILTANKNAKLVIPKISKNGMTLAIAEHQAEIICWKIKDD